jgi:hypothetical protein
MSGSRFERDSALQEKKVACRFTVDVVQFANLEPIEEDLLFNVSYWDLLKEKAKRLRDANS